MSVLKDIGFDKFLESLGLNESQVRVIYTNQIDKLQKQEAAILQSIDDLSKKTNALYEERKKSMEVFDAEKLGIEKSRKDLDKIRNEIKVEKTALEQEKRDITALHGRLDEAKTQIHKEHMIHQERVKSVDEKEKILSQRETEYGERDKELDRLKDEAYLQQKRLDEALKQTTILKESLDIERNEINGIKNALNEQIRLLASEKEVFLKNQSISETSLQVAKDKFNLDLEALEKETKAIQEVLQSREYKIVEAEKEIKNERRSLKSAKEKLEIEKAKKGE